MAAIGSSRISLKGPNPWGGMNLLSKSAPGRFILLENAYVNSDGSEIRMMPGYRCVIDPETRQRSTADVTLGYQATHIDAQRTPKSSFAGNPFYEVENTSPSESMSIWTKPGLMHCIEQVHGRWILVGESDVRREMILNSGSTAFVHVISYSDTGVGITLTLNQSPLATANTFNAVVDNDRVLLEGLTGSLASILNGKAHRLTSAPSGATLTIATTSGASVSTVSGQTGLIARVPTATRSGGLGVSDDIFSDCTIWTSLSRGDDQAAPSELVRCAHVANRMRDFGDATGNLKEGNANAATANGGTSRRRRMGLNYRLVPHVAGNRLILAAPGHGCVLQAPVVTPPSFTGSDTADGIGALGNSLYDRPRSLGIPKATCWEDPDKVLANTFHSFTAADPASNPDRVFGGTTATARNGIYQFKFAYLDESTGEMGLCSEPIVVSSVGSALNRQGFQFWIYYPGYLMHECLATAIVVFRTTRNGKDFYYDRTISMAGGQSTLGTPGAVSARYGLTPETTTTEFFHHVHYQALYMSDAALVAQEGTVPEVIEQMPMGCKASRTIRGFTFFGGALGDAGSRKEMFKGSATFEYHPGGLLDSIYPQIDEITFAFSTDVTAPIPSPFEGVETFTFQGSRSIPPAYEGQLLVSRSLFPWPRKEVLLNKLGNTNARFLNAANEQEGRFPDVRYQITETPLSIDQNYLDSTVRNKTAFLKLPRARLQVSEPDNPHITPATNTIVLANEIDDDIEGIGDAGGQAVICTQAKTYVIGFSQSPIGVQPEVASERFGCIAANSMVSFEGGCAWLSDRGPVAIMGGQVVWIGEPIADLFSGENALYLRDGDGMMRHSWACHDAERSLLYFGVFSDRNEGTDLETKILFNTTLGGWEDFRGSASQDLAWSKFPCDEILVFSYRSGAWSIWKPPMPIQWMTRGFDSYGVNRVFFLGQDRRVYVLDDTWVNGDKEIASFTADTEQTVTSLSTSVAHIAPWKGMEIMVVRTTAGAKSVISRATITTESVSGGVTTIGFDQSISMKVGDLVTIGAKVMRLQTTVVNPKQSDTSKGGPLVVSYTMDSREQTGPYDAFCEGRVISTRVRGGVPTKSDQTLNDLDSAHLTWLGSHVTDCPVRDRKVAQGQTVGQGHLFDVTILGNAQVRIQDLHVEVA